MTPLGYWLGWAVALSLFAIVQLGQLALLWAIWRAVTR